MTEAEKRKASAYYKTFDEGGRPGSFNGGTGTDNSLSWTRYPAANPTADCCKREQVLAFLDRCPGTQPGDSDDGAGTGAGILYRASYISELQKGAIPSTRVPAEKEGLNINREDKGMKGVGEPETPVRDGDGPEGRL